MPILVLTLSTFSPLKRTEPDVGFSRPFISWIKVDLPLPVWPIMPTSSLLFIFKETPSMAVFSKGVLGEYV